MISTRKSFHWFGLIACAYLTLKGYAAAEDGALSGTRHRVVVSTDIGGTDPDDFQSMVHLLVYADCFDLEGLISSPFGPGRKSDILTVIDHYERDYENLKRYSQKYPTAESLRSMTKQGETEEASALGVGHPTEGSQWIVECARRNDPRPLHVLVWGGLEDLAQALHDAPEILLKIRVYWIGGPNKKWSVNAYNYIEQNHPKLWIIEANATYRGWFIGGNQEGQWGNQEFVTQHVAGHGSLGDYFSTQLKGKIKMGDTPSVARLLKGQSDAPEQPSWGGQFVRIWDGRKTVFNRLTTETDKAEVFGVTEFELPKPAGFSKQHKAAMVFDGGIPKSKGMIDGEAIRFRFSARDAKVWSYVIESDFPALNGQSGKFDAVPPPVERTKTRSTVHPNWWIDDPDPATAEGVHPGAKSVNKWREEFLSDFAKRMDRCMPASGDGSSAQNRKSTNALDTVVGYANVGGPVVGGLEGETVTVTTGEELNQYASMKKPCTIYVSGNLQVKAMDTHVGPNKTIIGLGNDAGLQGGGLYLYKARNVIIRNLTIDGSSEDNIGILYSQNIWIDHCTLKNAKDGNLDISRASDNITVSWCKFLYDTQQSHALASLIGSNDNEVISKDKLHITFHHNWFGKNIRERMPSIRWGTVHIFNNYYNATGNNYCIRSRLNAQTRIEDNFFEGVRNPWELYITDSTSDVGKIFSANNVQKSVQWGKDSDKDGQSVRIVPGTDEVFTPPYEYVSDSADSVPDIVTRGAGAGAGPFSKRK